MLIFFFALLNNHLLLDCVYWTATRMTTANGHHLRWRMGTQDSSVSQVPLQYFFIYFVIHFFSLFYFFIIVSTTYLDVSTTTTTTTTPSLTAMATGTPTTSKKGLRHVRHVSSPGKVFLLLFLLFQLNRVLLYHLRTQWQQKNGSDMSRAWAQVRYLLLLFLLD